MRFTANGPVGVADLDNPAPEKGIRIGELLVDQGVLSCHQVERILDEQRRVGRPFGDIAEQMFGVSPQVIEDAWVEQYRRQAGTTDLADARVDAECLRRINRRQAWQFELLPLQREGGQMRVATHAGNLARGLNFAGRTFGDPVLMLLAERRQLREFLMRHYPVPKHMRDHSQTLAD